MDNMDKMIEINEVKLTISKDHFNRYRIISLNPYIDHGDMCEYILNFGDLMAWVKYDYTIMDNMINNCNVVINHEELREEKDFEYIRDRNANLKRYNNIDLFFENKNDALYALHYLESILIASKLCSQI